MQRKILFLKILSNFWFNQIYCINKNPQWLEKVAVSMRSGNVKIYNLIFIKYVLNLEHETKEKCQHCQSSTTRLKSKETENIAESNEEIKSEILFFSISTQLELHFSYFLIFFQLLSIEFISLFHFILYILSIVDKNKKNLTSNFLSLTPTNFAQLQTKFTLCTRKILAFLFNIDFPFNYHLKISLTIQIGLDLSLLLLNYGSSMIDSSRILLHVKNIQSITDANKNTKLSRKKEN